ncbi:hypothetical protein HK405_006404, partial [Cladochytrium tenue]
MTGAPERPNPAVVREQIVRLRSAVKQERRRVKARAALFVLAKYLVEETEILDPHEHEEAKKEAFSVLSKLSRAGVADAQYYLGKAYAEDHDYAHATPLFLKAARQSHPAACYALSSCYETGRGCKKDLRSANSYLRQSATAGNDHAMFRIGTALLHGEVGFPVNSREGIKWLKRCAASEASSIQPQVLLHLSAIYERGLGSDVPSDAKAALSYLSEAARSRFPPAQTRLARAHETGRLGLPVNLARAVALYKRAAAPRGGGLGDPEAQHALADLYLRGVDGVLPASDLDAVAWARRAAAQAHPGAEYSM